MKQGPAAALITRCEGMGVAIEPAAAGTLVALLDAMSLERQNLSSVEGLAREVDVHLSDSLSGLVVPELANATAVADLGTGGGFPGLALAVVLPGAMVTLVESERRKAEWLTRASAGFPNVRIVADRSESLARAERGTQSVVTARALGPLPVVLELAAPLLVPNGVLVAWRGRPDADALRAATRAADVLGMAHSGDVMVDPIPGASRHLSVWRKVAPTPERFPRRPGVAARRPLA